MDEEKAAQELEHALTLSVTNGHRTDGLASTEELVVAGEEEIADAGVCSEIVIFCHPGNVENLLAALHLQIEDAAGALPLRVIWSGRSAVLRQGVIVLSWAGMVPAEFRRQLAIDYEIFDVVIYEYEWGELEPEGGEPHTGALVLGTQENRVPLW